MRVVGYGFTTAHSPWVGQQTRDASMGIMVIMLATKASLITLAYSKYLQLLLCPFYFSTSLYASLFQHFLSSVLSLKWHYNLGKGRCHVWVCIYVQGYARGCPERNMKASSLILQMETMVFLVLRLLKQASWAAIRMMSTFLTQIFQL